jgi:hypothetical protein
MSLPKSWPLRWLMGMLLMAVFCKVWQCFSAEPQNLDEAAGRYVSGVILTYAFGAVWSELTFIRLLAWPAAITFCVALLWRGETAKSLAQLAFASLVLLSYFTIWIEPWVLIGLDPSVGSIGAVVVAEFLGLFVVDVGATIAYGVVLFIAYYDIEAEPIPRHAKDDAAEIAASQEEAREGEAVAVAAAHLPAAPVEDVLEAELLLDEPPPVRIAAPEAAQA